MGITSTLEDRMQQYEGYAVANLLGITKSELAQRLNISLNEFEKWIGTDSDDLDPEHELWIRKVLQKEFGTKNLYYAIWKRFFSPVGFTVSEMPDDEDSQVEAKLQDGDITVMISDDGISIMDDVAEEELSGIFELFEANVVAQKLSEFKSKASNSRDLVKMWVQFRGGPEDVAAWTKAEKERQQ